MKLPKVGNPSSSKAKSKPSAPIELIESPEIKDGKRKQTVHSQNRKDDSVVVLLDDEDELSGIKTKKSRIASVPDIEVVKVVKRNKTPIQSDDSIQIVGFKSTQPAGGPDRLLLNRFHGANGFSLAQNELYRRIDTLRTPNSKPVVSASAALSKQAIEDSQSAQAPSALFKCVVCLTEPKKDVQLSSTTCGHIFCSDCIKATLKHGSKCPVCRKRLTSKSIHRIYVGN